MNQEIIKIINSLPSPSKFLLEFDKEIVKSSLISENKAEMMHNIMNEFNKDGPNIMTESVFGERIEPGKFRIVALNKRPQLVLPGKMLRKSIYLSPKDKTEDIGIFDQTELCFGCYGTYVVNIPVNKVGLAWKGIFPVLLGPGPHVIHDQNFKLLTQNDLADINQPYIQHGNYHIIRVQPGFLGKITIDNAPYFLLPSSKPYVFNQPIFTFEEHLTPLSSHYIRHMNYHLLQVPQTYLAKVWFGTKAQILESRPEPYFFDDPTFILEKKSEKEPYWSTASNVIIHGPIKIIRPPTGQVAVTYLNGKLKTYRCQEDKPILIDSPTHIFSNFLGVNFQTIEFPSEESKAARKLENPNYTPDELNYEIFRTGDGLSIGVKLLVVYEIEDADVTLNKIDVDKIRKHIEGVVVADMVMVFQSCTSADFLKTNQTRARHTKDDVDLLTDKQSSEVYEFIQDKIKNKLRDDFSEYGIHLIRLNFDAPKILNKKIAEELEKNSVLATETRAKEATLASKMNIVNQEAQQEAVKSKVAQDQKNANTISEAKAFLEATQLKNAARLSEIETDVKGQQLNLELNKKRAELYEHNPRLFELDLAKVRAESMKNISTMVISPEVASMYFNMPWMTRNIESMKK